MLTRLWTNVINNNLTTNFFSAVSSFQLHIIDSLDERRRERAIGDNFSFIHAMDVLEPVCADLNNEQIDHKFFLRWF